MPASDVTSVNSISPEGRGGVGLGDGDATATCSAGAFAGGALGAGCLHEHTRNTRHTKRQYLCIRDKGLLPQRRNGATKPQ